MQGYLFSKPLPTCALAKLLRSTPVLASPPLQPETAVATVVSTAMSTTKLWTAEQRRPVGVVLAA